MTSPFVDRVEYQVIGRDTGASRVFRDVATEADRAGNEVDALGGSFGELGDAADDTSGRLRSLLALLADIAGIDLPELDLGDIDPGNLAEIDAIIGEMADEIGRASTAANGFGGALGSIDDNRAAIEGLGTDFQSLNAALVVTADGIVTINDGLQTIDDNRAGIAGLADDFVNLSTATTATVDSVVSLNDGLATIEDNRAPIAALTDDVVTLSTATDATVDSVVSLNDGLQSVEDNRAPIAELTDDVLTLSTATDATVDSVVRLNDGLSSVEDNRAPIAELTDDVTTLSTATDATVDSVVRLNDGLATVEDNRAPIAALTDDVTTLSSATEATVDSVVRLNDGLSTVEDNRAPIAALTDDVTTLSSATDATVDSVVRLNDGLSTVEDNRAPITNLTDDFNDLTETVDVTRNIIVQLNDVITTIGDNEQIPDLGRSFTDLGDEIEIVRRRITELQENNVNFTRLNEGIETFNQRVQELFDNERVIRTATDSRDRWERAGLILGGGLAAGAAAGTTSGLLALLPGGISAAISAIAASSAATLGAAAAIGIAIGSIIAAAIGSALLGAVGLGGIVGGLILAARDPQVKQRATEVGQTISRILGEASAMFVPVAIEALHTVERQFRNWEPQLKGIFTQAARWVDPLTDAMLGFIDGMLPGIEVAMGNLQPIFDELKESLPAIGDAIGDVFGMLGRNSEDFAVILRDVLDVVEAAIRVFGFFATAGAQLYRALRWIVEATVGVVKWFWDLIEPAAGLENAFGRLRTVADPLGTALALIPGLSRNGGMAIGDMGRAAGDAAVKAAELQGWIKKLATATNAMTDAGYAEIAMNESLADLKKHIADATKTQTSAGIDNTAAGRENYRMLLDNAVATKNSILKTKELTKDTGAAERATIAAAKKWVEHAVALGVDADKAADLAAAIFEIPLERITKADFQPDNAGVKAWKQTLSGIDRHIFIKAEFDLINNSDVAMALRLGRLSRGGPVRGPGPKGVDSKPYLLAPGEHVLTAAEVDAAGGHQNIIALRKSLMNGGHSGGGGGGSLEAAQRPAAGGPPVNAHTMALAMKRALSGMTLVIDDRTGRTAQLIARGG